MARRVPISKLTVLGCTDFGWAFGFSFRLLLGRDEPAFNFFVFGIVVL